MRAEVEWNDVEEALRLMQMSKASLAEDAGQRRKRKDDTTVIFEALRSMLQEVDRAQAPRRKGGRAAAAPINPRVAIQDLVDRLSRQYTRDQILAALDEYQGLQILDTDDAGNVFLVDNDEMATA